MKIVEVRVPEFAYPHKNPENPCPCEGRPVELSYKISKVFWQVADGDAVVDGEPIADLECEKKTLELLTPVSGTLSYSVEDGEEVEVNSLLGTIICDEENNDRN